MVSGVHDAADLDVMRPPPDRGRKGGKRASSASVGGEARASATAAAKSLDRAQDALGQAARTEKQLRDSLKRHRKTIGAVEDDLSKRRHDLKIMKSQLKVAKKARKRAVRKTIKAKPTASHG
jgi:predicted  nucleic acid-binding Zn-ribbon protein